MTTDNTAPDWELPTLTIDKAIREMMRKHSIAIENLTEKQLAEAMVQAIKCGDFQRFILKEDENQQCVTYVPFRDLPKLEADNARLREENTHFRASLAMSKDPCVYCQLPAEEMSKCRSGFPGCGRMDDKMGCPEFGASMLTDDLKAQLATAVRERDEEAKLADRFYAVASTLDDTHEAEKFMEVFQQYAARRARVDGK